MSLADMKDGFGKVVTCGCGGVQGRDGSARSSERVPRAKHREPSGPASKRIEIDERETVAQDMLPVSLSPRLLVSFCPTPLLPRGPAFLHRAASWATRPR